MREESDADGVGTAEVEAEAVAEERVPWAATDSGAEDDNETPPPSPAAFEVGISGCEDIEHA